MRDRRCRLSKRSKVAGGRMKFEAIPERKCVRGTGMRSCERIGQEKTARIFHAVFLGIHFRRHALPCSVLSVFFTLFGCGEKVDGKEHGLDRARCTCADACSRNGLPIHLYLLKGSLAPEFFHSSQECLSVDNAAFRRCGRCTRFRSRSDGRFGFLVRFDGCIGGYGRNIRGLSRLSGSLRFPLCNKDECFRRSFVLCAASERSSIRSLQEPTGESVPVSLRASVK